MASELWIAWPLRISPISEAEALGGSKGILARLDYLGCPAITISADL